MKFRYAHKRVSALTRQVQPTNSSSVLDWPPSSEEKPRENQTFTNLKNEQKTAAERLD